MKDRLRHFYVAAAAFQFSRKGTQRYAKTGLGYINDRG